MSKKDGLITIKLIITILKNTPAVDTLDSQAHHLGKFIEDMLCDTDSINTALIIHSSINSDAMLINDVLNNEPLEDDTSMNDETNRGKNQFTFFN